MRWFSAIAAAGALTLALAAPAAATPRLVAPSESAGNPAFAGNEIVYSAGLPAAGTEVRAVAPDGATRVVHRFSAPPPFPDPFDEGGGVFARRTFEIRGSSEALAVRSLGLIGDRYGYTSQSDIVGGPAGGGLATVANQCGQSDASAPGVDIEGSRLAYVQETCARSTPRRVVVRDLRTGAETTGPATGTREVAFAGHYLAYRPPAPFGTVEIYDVDSGRIVKTVSDVSGRFDVQADGTLADGTPQPFGQCTGGVRWRSLQDDAPHTVAGCEWTLGAIDDGHIGLVRSDLSAVAVVALGGESRVIQAPGAVRQEPDLDGNRILFTTGGCSTDTGGVWLDDGTDAPPPPALSECSVSLRQSRLRADRKRRVRVPVSCPTGCRGAIEVRGGRRYVESFNFGEDQFELPKGGRASVLVNLKDMSRRYRNRTLKVRVQVRINQRVNPYRTVSAVKYMKLRV